MKYFLHDTASFSDEKISELFIKYGYEGLGLFYTVIERLALQEKPVKTEVLKKQLFVGRRLEKCWSFMEDIGLISSKNGDTFNERILSYSETYQVKKERNKEKISQWRQNQQVEKNVTSYEPVGNPPKVKESKVKENKVNKKIANAISGDKSPLPDFEKDEKTLKKEFDQLQIPENAKEAWVMIKEWIEEKKPLFIDPYVVAWNIYSSWYKYPALKKINEPRRRKFRTRIRESGFDFFEILAKASKSEFLKGASFFCFDWIIENEMNYTKILEENYK